MVFAKGSPIISQREGAFLNRFAHRKGFWSLVFPLGLTKDCRKKSKFLRFKWFLPKYLRHETRAEGPLEREREREKAEGQRVRAGQLGFFAKRSAFFPAFCAFL